jgi:hypothetical protein
LLNGKPSRSGKLLYALAGAQRLVESAPDASQRGSQIMGNRIGYVPHAIHQMLDPVEHIVDVPVEPREFILNARYRDPPAEVAGLYFEGGAADRANAMPELPAKQQSAADCEY